MDRVDLHTHSTASDGTCTPIQLVELAKQVGLSAVAVTDHETIDGVAAAQQRAAELDIGFLPGLEMTVEYGSRRLHIVSLDFDAQHPAFQTAYQKVRRFKERDMQEIVERINAEHTDVQFTLDDLRQLSYNGNLDRYTIMRYFVSLGRFDEVKQIWESYLSPVMRDYNENIQAEEWFQAVSAAGGVTLLAHYHKKIGLANLSRPEQEQTLCELHALGLDGMERYYPSYTAEDGEFAAYLIDKYHLAAGGGSDFHGKNRPRVSLGSGYEGRLRVPYSIYENLLARRK